MNTPSWLRWTLGVATALVVAGVAAAWLSWLSSRHLWNDGYASPTSTYACSRQLDDRKKRLEDIASDLRMSRPRTTALAEIASDPKSPGLVSARARFELDREEAFRKGREARKKGLEFEHGPLAPAKDAALFLFFLALVAYVATRVARTPEASFRGEPLKPTLLRPMAVATAVLFVPALLVEIDVSMLNQHKSWFGWSSYCVSPGSFLFTKISLLGCDLAAGAIVAMFWSYLRSSSRPSLDLGDAEARKRVSLYVDFLRKWSFWGIALVALVLVVWLVWASSAVEPAEFEKGYAVAALGAIVAPGYLLFRVVENIQELQSEYAQQVAASSALAVHPDPTARLVGEGSWRLPTTAAAVITAAGYTLTKLGIVDLLTRR